jgi:hypothetical protein
VDPSPQAGNKSESASRSFSLRERFLLWLISWSAYLLIRLIGPTLRFTSTLEEGCTYDGVTIGQAIHCFWHRSVIPATYHFRGLHLAVMTSRSFDGEYIARIIGKFGFRAVRGSSSRGAVGALIGMRKELELGHSVVFTIDGPRGPVYVAKPGPVLLAKKTGYKITCFYIALERAWILNSWDRMMVPKPFSRAVLYASAPIAVPPDASEQQMEALHQQMQATLERCRLEAEARLH